MKTQTETFRGYGKEKRLSAQTAVECRFGQEVAATLAVHAHVALTGAEAGNGEVRYFGKAHFFLVYEDAEHKVCRAERGVEFSARVADDACYPALAARASAVVENVSVRREGASVYATALIGADISLYGETSLEYLTDGDLVLKREPVKAVVAHLCGGATETEDEFETEPIGDILMHGETVSVSEISCEEGILRAEGEIELGILALKGEALASFERLVPFRIEIPCERAAFGCGGEASVRVLDVAIKADSDEERGKCRIRATLTLGADGCVYEEVGIDGVTDAFSRTHEVTLGYSEGTFECAGETSRLTERISGRAVLSSPVDFTDTLQAVALQRAEANLVATENGNCLEGVAMATLLVAGSDGSHRGVEMSLPFSVPVHAEGCTAEAFVCGTQARQKQEGEIDMEATLKIVLHEKKSVAVKLVCSAEEGAPCEISDSAVSVYIPRAGDGIWELSKRLKKSPEEVAASNPDLEFPVKEGQRVIVYRKKNVV